MNMKNENQNGTVPCRDLTLAAISRTGVKAKSSYVPAQIRIGALELENAFLSVSVVDINSVSVMEYEDGFIGSPGSEYEINFD